MFSLKEFLMPPKKFLINLNKKLKIGNMRSVHLNALPGRYATRLDFEKLNLIKFLVVMK